MLRLRLKLEIRDVHDSVGLVKVWSHSSRAYHSLSSRLFGKWSDNPSELYESYLLGDQLP